MDAALKKKSHDNQWEKILNFPLPENFLFDLSEKKENFIFSLLEYFDSLKRKTASLSVTGYYKKIYGILVEIYQIKKKIIKSFPIFLSAKV
jgi:hypothetical protein